MTRTFEVAGMHCAGCVERLRRAFRTVPGVRRASVTLDPPRAEVEGDERVTPEALDRAARGAGAYRVGAEVSAGAAPWGPPAATPGVVTPPGRSLYPLVLIVAYIAGTATLAEAARGPWSWMSAMNTFMAGFFLVFSFFKLLDLRGFASAYAMYDVVAARWRVWGFMYPFVELALGVAYVLRWRPDATNAAALVLMLLGAAGVLRALSRKDRIRCACLGTALNLPMTTVTLVEDLGMAAMAGAALFTRHGAL